MKRQHTNPRRAHHWLNVLMLAVRFLAGGVVAATVTHDLEVEVLPRFAGRELAFDSLAGTTAAAQRKTAIGSWSAMVGALVLARMSDDAALSDEILAATRAFIERGAPIRR